MPYEFDTEFPRFYQRPLLPYSSEADMSEVGIVEGICWDDSEMFAHEEVSQLAKCHYEVFKDSVDAQFMWTARTEIEDRWSYIKSYDRGWTNPSEL